jgi:hypothetical protein
MCIVRVALQLGAGVVANPHFPPAVLAFAPGPVPEASVFALMWSVVLIMSCMVLS